MVVELRQRGPPDLCNYSPRQIIYRPVRLLEIADVNGDSLVDTLRQCKEPAARAWWVAKTSSPSRAGIDRGDRFGLSGACITIKGSGSSHPSTESLTVALHMRRACWVRHTIGLEAMGINVSKKLIQAHII